MIVIKVLRGIAAQSLEKSLEKIDVNIKKP